jgi:hypothetical protein
MNRIENIKLGKKIYDKCKENPELNQSVIIMNVASEQNCSFHDAYLSLAEYTKRVVEPKPKEKENRHKYDYNSDVIKALLNAENDNMIKAIMNKYDEGLIKISINYYLKNNPYKIAEHDKLKSIFIKMKELKASKNHPTSKISKQDKFTIILEKYLASNDIYPDDLIGQFYTDIKPFYTSLRTFENGSDEDQKIYNAYQNEMSKRVDNFLNALTIIFEQINPEKISLFDTEKICGTHARAIITALAKADAINIFSKSKCDKLRNRLIELSKGKYKDEDANSLKHTYKGIIMSEEDLEFIIDFLRTNNFSLTYGNIYDAFKKQVDGTLIITSKTFE